MRVQTFHDQIPSSALPVAHLAADEPGQRGCTQTSGRASAGCCRNPIRAQVHAVLIGEITSVIRNWPYAGLWRACWRLLALTELVSASRIPRCAMLRLCQMARRASDLRTLGRQQRDLDE
jgi:hypothetical protein